MRLIEGRDRRRENLPTADEVAGIRTRPMDADAMRSVVLQLRSLVTAALP